MLWREQVYQDVLATLREGYDYVDAREFETLARIIADCIPTPVQPKHKIEAGGPASCPTCGFVIVKRKAEPLKFDDYE